MLFTKSTNLLKANIWRYIACCLNGPKVAHHGIQRSGTNYICALLIEKGYIVLNKYTPLRKDCRHKHFRWQSDKETILMNKSFLNDIQISNIKQLNKLAGYPRNTLHIVIFKKPESWIVSIQSWAYKCGWDIQNETLNDYIKEWDEYYSAWEILRDSDPSRVVFINYEELVKDPAGLMMEIDKKFPDHELRNLKSAGYMRKVPHSSDRAYANERVYEKTFVLPELKFNWRNYVNRKDG